jgi:hypothetical protein
MGDVRRRGKGATKGLEYSYEFYFLWFIAVFYLHPR